MCCAILQKYFPMVASLTEWTSAPFVVALKEALRANIIGTDYDDLESMDT
jgi:hypothetical protein